MPQQRQNFFSQMFQTLMRDLLAQKANERIMNRQFQMMLSGQGIDPGTSREDAAREIRRRMQEALAAQQAQTQWGMQKDILAEQRAAAGEERAVGGEIGGLIQGPLSVARSRAEAGDPYARAAIPGAETEQDLAPWREVIKRGQGASTRERQPSTREMLLAAGVGPGREPPIAQQDPRAIYRELAQAQERRTTLPTALQAAGTLGDLGPGAVAAINQAATSVREGAITRQALETAQRVGVARNMLAEKSGPRGAEIAQSNVDAAVARAAARFLEPDRLSDADFDQIVGIGDRTVLDSLRLKWDRLMSGESAGLTEGERNALVAMIEHGEELNQRLVENQAEQAVQSMNALFGVPVEHLRRIITAPNLTALSGQGVQRGPWIPQ